MKIDYNLILVEARDFLLFIAMAFSSSLLFAQSTEQRKMIQETNHTNELSSVIERFEKEFKVTKTKLALKDYEPIEKRADGTVVALNGIGPDGAALFYTTLVDPTSRVYRANALHKGGALQLQLDGSNLDIGVWDAGAALASHQEFTGRAVNADTSDEISRHATLVTGTMISQGIKEKAKGVAFAANALTHDWSRDKIEVAHAASNGLLVSNHSYGIKSDRVPDWYFGAYLKISKDWDEIMYHAPYYLMVNAAGNARNSKDNMAPNAGQPGEGFDLLLGFTTSKNGLTIAGANSRIDEDGEIEYVEVAPYSSFGPIDDGRIKPDLAGDGTAIFSTTSASNNSYSSASGTSMATPGVTASLLLLQQYHEQLFGQYMKAATLKGLALHTADDIYQKGPDYKMGWGLLNVKKAAEELQKKEYSTLISEERLSNTQTYSIKVTAKENEPLIASLSWTDPVGAYNNQGILNDTTPALTHDLDIRITKDGQTYYPWKLNPYQIEAEATKGDNLVDPYERIEIENASGEYTITISHKGILNETFQDFSLIVSGVKLSDCELAVPVDFQLQNASAEEIHFTWNPLQEALYEVQYREKTDEEWITLHTWENEVGLYNLEKNKRYQMRVRSVCTENLASDFNDAIEFVFEGSETKVIVKPSAIAEALRLSLYPNPVTHEVSVLNETAAESMYTVVDASGTKIKQGVIENAINVAELSSGFYVLMVQDSERTRSAKFYKK